MFEVMPHTADLRLKVRGSSREDLFREALRGMTAAMRAGKIDPASESRRTVVLESVDPTSLLVDFLNEVLFFAQVHREVFDRVNFRVLTDTRLEAELSGHRASEFGVDIKAATYHEAEVRQNEAGEWETTLVFDV